MNLSGKDERNGSQELYSQIIDAKLIRLQQMIDISDIPQAFISFGEDGIEFSEANNKFNDFVAQLFNKDYLLAIDEFKKSILQWDINHQEIFPLDISAIDGYKIRIIQIKENNFYLEIFHISIFAKEIEDLRRNYYQLLDKTIGDIRHKLNNILTTFQLGLYAIENHYPSKISLGDLFNHIKRLRDSVSEMKKTLENRTPEEKDEL